MMAANGGGRIVFVGSFLALTTFVGYAGYAPGKYALKGKAPLIFLCRSSSCSPSFRIGRHVALRVPPLQHQRTLVPPRRDPFTKL